MIGVEVRLAGFAAPLAMLERIDANLENMDPMREKLGVIVRDAIKSYIELGGTYDKTGGVIFPPTDWRYSQLEGKGHQRPLYWTGELYHSIVYALNSAGVSVGSPLDYAPYVLLADGSTPRHYARETVDGQWVPGGQVVEMNSVSLMLVDPGFKQHTTVIQRRDALHVFIEDVQALLAWFDSAVLQGAASA